MTIQFKLQAALAAAILAGTTSAHALCAHWSPDMTASTVTANGDGTFHYQVFADGRGASCDAPGFDSLVGFYLPYFADMGLADVRAADGWTATVEATDDLFHLGGGVLHFQAALPAGGTVIPGAEFDFDAAYAGTTGPFASALFNGATGESLYFGDPLIPASPDTVAALAAAAVPEPPAWALMLAAVVAAVGLVRRRSRPR